MQISDLPRDLPDARGHFGPYGGVFVSETLVHALDELRLAYEKYRKDPEFIREFEYELKHYVGRPSPVYHAKPVSRRRLCKHPQRRGERRCASRCPSIYRRLDRCD